MTAVPSKIAPELHSAYRPDEARAEFEHGDIAMAMGLDAWSRLCPAIRERFKGNSGDYGFRIYEGVMSTVACSRFGWLLAQFCRLIGSPIAPYRGVNIPVVVAVYPDPAGDGIAWDRTYSFPDRGPVTVRSSKVLNARRRLLECVGRGFGMELDVYGQDRVLHFVSTRYFWTLRGVRIRLPAVLTPGVAHVIHTDEGDGLFRFTITFTHALLGTLIFQDGLFAKRGETRWKPC